MRVQERRLLMVGPGEGKSVSLGGLGVDFKVWGHGAGGRFAIVEHRIDARCLITAQRHKMEDELSYFLEGRVGVRVGAEVAEAGPGTYIYKPCGIPHTFWNPTDQPARLLEIICNAGFENYFVEISELFATGAKPGGTEHEALAARYNERHFMDWVHALKARYGLNLPADA